MEYLDAYAEHFVARPSGIAFDDDGATLCSDHGFGVLRRLERRGTDYIAGADDVDEPITTVHERNADTQDAFYHQVRRGSASTLCVQRAATGQAQFCDSRQQVLGLISTLSIRS